MIELTERKARKEKFRVEALERIFEKPYHGDYDDCSYEDGHSNVHLCTACEENQSTGQWINETMDNLIHKLKYYTEEQWQEAYDQALILAEGCNYSSGCIPCEDWHGKRHRVLRKHETEKNTWRGLEKDEVPNKDDMHEIECEVCGWSSLYEDYLKEQL